LAGSELESRYSITMLAGSFPAALASSKASLTPVLMEAP